MLKVNVNDNGFDTWTWRKHTHTGLLLNFNALCPMKMEVWFNFVCTESCEIYLLIPIIVQ